MLQILDLHGNSLNQSIPWNLTQFTALQIPSLSSNEFSGSIPTGIGDMVNPIIYPLPQVLLFKNHISSPKEEITNDISYSLDEVSLTMSQLDWHITPKKKTKLWRFTKIEGTTLKSIVPPLWPTYMT